MPLFPTFSWSQYVPGWIWRKFQVAADMKDLDTKWGIYCLNFLVRRK